MKKGNMHKHGYQNFLHLGDIPHHIEVSFVAAYDWSSGPGMSKKYLMEHKLAENESVRRVGPLGF